jgi:hypothetical protein
MNRPVKVSDSEPEDLTPKKPRKSGKCQNIKRPVEISDSDPEDLTLKKKPRKGRKGSGDVALEALKAAREAYRLQARRLTMLLSTTFRLFIAASSYFCEFQVFTDWVLR